MARNRAPLGQSTRGKTARNRLRRADIFITRYAPNLLCRHDGAYRNALFVDPGIGAEPTTTLEIAQRFNWFNPDLITLGVEIDQERMDAAMPFKTSKIKFRHDGLNLPLREGETIRLLRAFNVLRQ